MEHEGLQPFSLEPTDSASSRWERWVRRFDNFLVAKNIDDMDRAKALLLHYAGEDVFDLSEALGVVAADSFTATKKKLTDYFAPKRNTEFEVFTFRQAQQQQNETLDQFHMRLRQLAKHCAFHDDQREIKSQIIQKCLLQKVRDKGLSETGMTLENLLTYGRTLEATLAQSKAMGISNAGTGNDDKAVNRVQNEPLQRDGGYGGRNPAGVVPKRPRDTPKDETQGNRRNPQGNATNHYQNTGNRRNNQQGNAPNRYRGYGSQGRGCTGCGGPPHARTDCRAWGQTCFKC